MALFKVLRGSSDDFVTDLTRADVTPPFNDGFCYFLKDTRMFYIDYAIKDGNGNVTERHRVPLNADDALSLEGAILNRTEINDNADEIPSSKAVFEEIARIDLLLSQIGGDGLIDLQNNKMDKVNPTGSGAMSINRLENSTIGDYSVALGDSTEAIGLASFAVGINSHGVGVASFAEGVGSLAEGRASHAEGNSTIAEGDYSHSEGALSKASAHAAHAEGENTEASGEDSHSEGCATKAQGNFSHAEGNHTTATHKAQHVEGEWNVLDPSPNTAGNRGTYVHITGIGTGDTDRKNGFTVDWSGNLWGARSLGHGNNVSSSGENSYAGGNTVIASGVSSHAEGSNNEAQGVSSHSEGDSTLAQGNFSHAEGSGSQAQDLASHAEGQETQATNAAAHAEGCKTVAEGEYSHAEGYKTKAAAEKAHSEGGYTLASGRYSHTEGGGFVYDHLNVSGVAGSLTYTIEAAVDFDPTDCYLLNGQEYGRIVDYDSSALTITLDKTINADLDLTNVEVDIVAYTESAGERSHAEGKNAIAFGEVSHAEGYKTRAYGNYSHVGGYCSQTNGAYSFASGYYVNADGTYSTVFGKYNTLDTDKTLAFAIGNGTADDARKNIFQVAWDGSAYLENRLNIAGLELEQDAAGYTLFVNGPAFFSGTVKAAEPIAANDLATKNYVDNNLPRMTHSWITATAGQSEFDFATPDDGCVAAADLADYYYIYFNGLLLIPDLHYSISGSIVTFIGWAAEAGDVCHIVGFKPINPTA